MWSGVPLFLNGLLPGSFFLETRLMQFAFPLMPVPDPVAPFCLIQQKDKGLKDSEFPQVSQGGKGRGETPPKARKLQVLETRGATWEAEGPAPPMQWQQQLTHERHIGRK